MKRVAMLLVVLGLIGGGWFVFGERGATVVPTTTNRAPLTGRDSPPLSRPASTTAMPEREPDGASPNGGSGDEGNDEQSGELVEGSIVVVDRDDGNRESNLSDGLFRPFFRNCSASESGRAMPVVDGRFKVRVPPGSQLTILDLTLDGRPAEPDHPYYLVEPGTPLTVRAYFGRFLSLHVVDAESRAELTDVTLVAINGVGRWGPSGWIDGYRPQSVVADHVASPVRLDGGRVRERAHRDPILHAIAPGHAWGSLDIDLDTGGDSTLALRPGGELVATVSGDIASSKSAAPLFVRARIPRNAPSPVDLAAAVEQKLAWYQSLDESGRRDALPGGLIPTRAELRARMESERKIEEEEAALGEATAELPLDPHGPTSFRGLPAGPLLVTLERGESSRRPEVLARQPAAIAAGGVTRVELAVTRPTERDRVPLAGTVYVAPEWGVRDIEFHFEPALVDGSTDLDEFDLTSAQLHPITGKDGLFSFDAGRVLPGRWIVDSSVPCEVQQLIDTGSEGTRYATIVVGDPAAIVVHLLDARDDTPLRGRRLLYWNCRCPDESRGNSAYDAEWDETLLAWTFRAPAGEITLDINPLEFEDLVPAVVVAKPGNNEFIYRVGHRTALELSFAVNGAPIDWPAEIAPPTKLIEVDGTHPPVGPVARSNGTHFYAVPSPGRWRVELPPLEGFEPVAPFELTLDKGVVTKRVIELRRAAH